MSSRGTCEVLDLEGAWNVERQMERTLVNRVIGECGIILKQTGRVRENVVSSTGVGRKYKVRWVGTARTL